LTKIRITFGYICFKGEVDTKIIPVLAGILFLACSSAVFNHIQEWKTDGLMDRTKNRPIPSGRITLLNALKLAIILFITGSIILYIGGGLLAWSLALLNLIWYNGIYTVLKKFNPLAIIPGSLVGAIPPVVGWVSAGGYVFDPQIIIISFFFFIWQIPHLWLLLLVFSKDYEQAGFPTLTQIFNPAQLSRITFIWIIATVVTGLIIPLFGIVKYPVIDFSLLLAGIWLSWNALKLLKSTGNRLSFRFAFREINIFALLVVILISIDKLIV
jgi:protoheme IX farnesyltransferase